MNIKQEIIDKVATVFGPKSRSGDPNQTGDPNQKKPAKTLKGTRLPKPEPPVPTFTFSADKEIADLRRQLQAAETELARVKDRNTELINRNNRLDVAIAKAAGAYEPFLGRPRE